MSNNPRNQAIARAVGLAALGVVLLLYLGSRVNRRMTRTHSVADAASGRVSAGQAIVVPGASIHFSPNTEATEFDARDPKGQRQYRFVVIEDAGTGAKLPMLYWRENFLDAKTVDGVTRAEVRGVLRPLSGELRESLLEELPMLVDEASVPHYLDEMEFPTIPNFAVLGGLIGLGLIGFAALELWHHRVPLAADEVEASAGRSPAGRAMADRSMAGRSAVGAADVSHGGARGGGGRPAVVVSNPLQQPGVEPQVIEMRRTCRACGTESPAASRCCNLCKAPIEVEYYVAGAVPFEGFERFVPVVSTVLGVSEYQARTPMARVHTAIPYHHLDGFHVKGPSASAPFRIINRGIPSLVQAQALADELKDSGVESVVVGSDELIGGPFPRSAHGLVYDDKEVTFEFQDTGETENRAIPWHRIALIVFSADIPLRGTMTIAGQLREGVPRDASHYIVDIYERDKPEGIRIAEDGFYRWNFLKLAGSERPADRFGKLMELLQHRVPSADVHFVTGVHRAADREWRINFYSRQAYVVGDKCNWVRQEGPPKLDGYEMLEKVGEGAMGAVYKARQKKLGRIVAVKIVAPHLAVEKKFLARFEAEARAVASLSHPNIVQVIDLVQWGERYFLVMEFVEGQTLLQRIKALKRLPERDTLLLGLQVTRALEHAARRGIIHRDIKPDNIFITTKGEVKVGDWGLAKDLSEDLGLTDTGTAVGTPYYMSPEQARARKDLDWRTDIYSLGATLYHAIVGRPPFEGDGATDVLMKHLTQSPPDARLHAPNVSDATAELLLQTLAKVPDERCTDVDKLLAKFDAALRASENAALELV